MTEVYPLLLKVIVISTLVVDGDSGDAQTLIVEPSMCFTPEQLQGFDVGI